MTNLAPLPAPVTTPSTAAAAGVPDTLLDLLLADIFKNDALLAALRKVEQDKADVAEEGFEEYRDHLCHTTSAEEYAEYHVNFESRLAALDAAHLDLLRPVFAARGVSCVAAGMPIVDAVVQAVWLRLSV